MIEIILSKTARDGHTAITVSLRERPATTVAASYQLVVHHGGRELPVFHQRPRRMEPVEDLTHGLVIGLDSRSVGLTAAEAATIDRAIDAWEAANLAPRPTDAEVRLTVAALHCKECGGRLSDLDIEGTALEGYHPDCV